MPRPPLDNFICDQRRNRRTLEQHSAKGRGRRPRNAAESRGDVEAGRAKNSATNHRDSRRSENARQAAEVEIAVSRSSRIRDGKARRAEANPAGRDPNRRWGHAAAHRATADLNGLAWLECATSGARRRQLLRVAKMTGTRKWRRADSIKSAGSAADLTHLAARGWDPGWLRGAPG